MAVFEFDGVVVDGPGFRARRGDRTLELEPKALAVLLVLLERRGQLVTKQELQAAVWPDTAVTESALTRVVAQLRKALEDDARDARYIETVPTRGYRFVAAVTVGDGTPAVSPPAPAAVETRPRPIAAWLAAGAALALVAALAFALTRPRTAAGGRSPARQPVMLTAAPGVNASPSFSPDGASLAFASDRSGVFEIYVRGVDPNARETAVTSDGQQNIQPAWSPDGLSIAYASLGRGGIWVVPALGGTPRRLSPFGARPAWSPDSATVVFQSQTPTYPLLASGGSGSVLFTVAAGGGEPRALTRRAGWGHGAASFSKDGTRIAYAAGQAVWTIRPDGTDARLLHEFGADLDDLFYAPDGRSMYVSAVPSAPIDPAGRIVRLPLSSAAEAAGPPVTVGDDGGAKKGQLTLAPDGRRIAFVEVRPQHQLDVVDLAPDGSPAGAPRPLLPQLTLRPLAPTFSPDGRRVAFAAFRPGGGWSLWIADAEGRDAQTVRAAPIVRSYLSWLKDGRIALTEAGPGGKGSRLVAFDPVSGREDVLLETDFALGSARVTPDGARVAYMRNAPPDDVLQVFTADLPRGTPAPLTSDPEGAGWPAWSPDGRTLVIEALRRGDTMLGLVSASGGAVRPLADRPSQSWPGEFSADGRRFVFAAQRRGVWNVCLVEVATRAERCVTSYTSFDGYVRTPAFSPAGDRVVFERGQIASRVWVGELPDPEVDR